MSGSYPISDFCNSQSAAGPFGSTPTAGTANVKGAWSQIIASTTYDSNLLCIEINGDATSSETGISFDIGIGGAGSEVVLIPDLYYNIFADTGARLCENLILPLRIAAGTRLSVRVQSSIASVSDYSVNCQLFDNSFPTVDGCAGVDAIGFVSATTTGTVGTPGAAGAKGSYAQLVASTSKDYVGFFVSTPIPIISNNWRSWDIAVGAAASEQIIIPDLWSIRNLDAVIVQTLSVFYPVPVPAGQRLSARVAANSADVTTSQIVVYGVYQ